MKVGWIGLGNIGRLMAMHTVKGGHDVVGHSRDFSRHQDLADAGARLTSSAPEVAAHAEVLCVNVFDDGQLRAAVVDSGALAAMRPGAVLVVHSTGAPDVIEDIARQAPEGVHVLDAPFSASNQQTAAADVTVLVGGDTTALEAARPPISTYGRRILPIGPLGAARRLKLINNMLYAANLAIAGEAVAAAEAMGLERHMAVAALEVSSGASYALPRFGGERSVAQVLDGASRYLDKDADLLRAAARNMGFDVPLLEAVVRWGAKEETA